MTGKAAYGSEKRGEEQGREQTGEGKEEDRKVVYRAGAGVKEEVKEGRKHGREGNEGDRRRSMWQSGERDEK